MGVTEVLLRRLREGHNRVEMDKIKFSGVREEGLKEVEFDYNGRTIHHGYCQWTWKCRCADEEDPEGRGTLRLLRLWHAGADVSPLADSQSRQVREAG